LKRELSRISRISTTRTGKLEEGTAAEDDFNLDEYLNGLRDDQSAAGHVPKNLGLIWKNLTIKVIFYTVVTFFLFTYQNQNNRVKPLMHILSPPSSVSFSSGNI
jgi:hypothetical protein